MTSLITLLAGAALILLVAGLVAGIASTIARLGGGLLVIDGLGNLVIAPGHAHSHGLPEVGIGLSLWLAGHWIHAARHRNWRSRLGLTVWSAPVLHLLAPIPTNHQPRPPRAERRPKGPQWATPANEYRSQP